MTNKKLSIIDASIDVVNRAHLFLDIASSLSGRF